MSLNAKLYSFKINKFQDNDYNEYNDLMLYCYRSKSNEQVCSKIIPVIEPKIIHVIELKTIPIIDYFLKIKQYFPNLININKNIFSIPNIKSINFDIINNTINIYKYESVFTDDFLFKIKIIAIELNIKYITIIDTSIVNINDKCSYSFSTYYILLYGVSKYNKYGFYSDDHDENKIYNNKKRILPFNKFIKKAIYKYSKENTIDFVKKDIIRNFKKYLTELNIETPMNQIIYYINHYFKKNDDLKYNNLIVIFLLNLIEISQYNLKYNNILRWTNPNL